MEITGESGKRYESWMDEAEDEQDEKVEEEGEEEEGRKAYKNYDWRMQLQESLLEKGI